jgi:hypothetical protein
MPGDLVTQCAWIHDHWRARGEQPCVHPFREKPQLAPTAEAGGLKLLLLDSQID